MIPWRTIQFANGVGMRGWRCPVFIIKKTCSLFSSYKKGDLLLLDISSEIMNLVLWRGEED